MDIQQLRYFVEIARNKNFTQAAKQLYITQPMLTRVIKQLEQEFNAKLIERSSKHFELTDVGEAFYIQAQDLLIRYDNLYHTIDDIKSTQNGEVRLSTPGVLLDIYFVPLMLQFRQRFPGIKINIIEEGSKLVAKSVLSNQVDLGMVMLPVQQSSKLDINVVVRDEVCLLVGRGHRLASRRQTPLQSLKDENIITFSDTTTLHDQFIQMCENHGFYPRIVYKSMMPNFTTQLLATNDCVAVLPRPLAQWCLTDQLTIVSLEQDFPWEIAVIRRKECYQSFASAKFKKFICSHFETLS